jgi:hypothetical protein
MLFSSFTDLKFRGFVILYKGKPFGILHPATLYIENKKSIQILGPKGVIQLEKKADTIFIISSLLHNGNVIIGSPLQIKKVNEFLIDSRLSRTTSYLLSICLTCSEIINFYKKINSLSLGIFGCGGIGSLSAVILSYLPFKEIVLIDPDIIEYSNFNRQVFWKIENIGQSKIDVLKKHIQSRNKEIKINTHCVKLNEDNLTKFIEEVDCILFTADYPIGINNIAKNIALKKNKFFIATGYSFTSLLFDNHSKIEKTSNNWQSIDQHVMPSAGPINAEGAGIVSNLLLQMIFYNKKKIDFKSPSLNTWLNYGVF